MGESTKAKPDWLNNVLLQKALQSYKNDSTIDVSDFTINAGFSEHFGSSMFQITIEFTSKKFPKSKPESLNVVVKAKPEVDKGITIDAGPLFETEIKMYNEVLPAMNQLFERSGMKVDLAPE